MGSFHPTATPHGVDVVFPANAGIHVSSPASVCPRVGAELASGLEFNLLPEDWGYVDPGVRRKDERDARIAAGPG